jgi:hypothetical protein
MSDKEDTSDPQDPFQLPPPDDWDESRRRRADGISDLAARFIRAGAEAVVNTGGKIKERGEDFRARDVLAGAVNATARGKDEVVTLVAKEVRTYLDKLELGKEIAEFARTHELEVNARFSLKEKPTAQPPAVVEEAAGD